MDISKLSKEEKAARYPQKSFYDFPAIQPSATEERA